MTLTRAGWTTLFLATLACGLALIGATRVRPTVGAAPPPVALEATPAPEVGRLAPDFTLETADGGSVRLADLRGRVVLVNLWATWCPPCRAEMPAIQAVYERHGPAGLSVLAVNVAEEPATVAAFLREHGLSFAAPLDRDGAVSHAYRSSALPSSFFIDRRGVIRAIYRGPMSHGVIAGTVEQLLAEGE
ncbi:MAG TPA: TlpA disulfide reductase family protein [Chloroflexaceae bacterium]|nr:TlpA disulfide reductase family protein [Chloroflexaceae bacterium]